MSRTPPEQLREAVATRLLTYLGEGVLCEPAVTAAIDPTALDITELDRLCRLRFVLSSDVSTFVADVPERLRRIRTSSRRSTERERGTVSGRIDWPQTHAVRSRAGHDDPTLYATHTQCVEYDLPENRVVKRLLSVVVSVVRDELLTEGYDWQSEWSSETVAELTRVYRENQYLSQLPDVDSYTVSERDLDAARRSRHELYRDAAKLLRLYRDLLDERYDRDAVQELLRETLITPRDPARLFELYAVFELLDALDTKLVRYQTVEPGTGAIASLETSETTVAVYYDETGPITLSEPLPSVEAETLSPPFSRELAAMERYDRHREAILGRGSQGGYYRGRPDIVVCVFSRGGEERSLRAVTLGEVKYTRRNGTLARGLRELSEYLQFARYEDTYLTDTDVTLSGLVVTNDSDRVDRHENVVHTGLSPSGGGFETSDVIPSVNVLSDE
jgi:hypothetical protein